MSESHRIYTRLSTYMGIVSCIVQILNRNLQKIACLLKRAVARVILAQKAANQSCSIDSENSLFRGAVG
jgi:hypothetical protein